MHKSFRCYFIVLMMWLLFACDSKRAGQRKVTRDSAQLTLVNADVKDIIQSEIDLSLEFLERDLGTAYTHARGAYVLSEKFGDTIQMVKSGRISAQVLWLLEKVDEAILIATNILPSAKRLGLVNDSKRILNVLAIAHTFKAEFPAALNYHFQSLEIREAERDTVAIRATLNNIGLVYFKLLDVEKAIYYYDRGLSFRKAIGDSGDREILLVNKSLCYNYLKKYREAIKSVDLALSSGLDTSKRFRMLADNAKAIALSGLGRASEATALSEASYKMAQDIGDRQYQAENLLFLSRIRLENHDYTNVENMLTEAECLANEIAYNQILLEIYVEFVNLYSSVEHCSMTRRYQKKYAELNDIIYTRQLHNITDAQVDLEQQHSNELINSQRELLVLKESALLEHKILNIFICISVFLLSLLVIFLFTVVRRKQRINILLNKKVKDRTERIEETLQRQTRKSLVQTQFVASARRDLYAQIGTISGLISLLSLEKKDEKHQNEIASRLKETAKNMSAQVDKLGRGSV